MRNFKRVSGLFSGLHAGVALSGLAVAAICQPGAAWAQAAATPAADDEQPADAKEIIVTGTLLRGVAPAGTNIIALSKDVVKETGATTTSQLLQSIPQFGSFNNLQAPNPTTGNFVTSNRPNLRSFPGYTTTGSSATLMLIDGHRVVGMGISSTSPDIDIIPPGVIERVEIVPDGGSAIYGSDAVAGVINFITRSNINGIEADARYGFADNYKSFDANFTVGHSWDTGSIYISHNYSEHSSIFGRDRGYVQTYPANTGLAVPITSIECLSGNVNVRGSANVYGLPFTTATAASKLNLPNQCDLSDGQTIYPQEKRHAVFAGLTQQLSDSLKFEVRAYYMDRQQHASGGFYHSTQLLVSPLLAFTGLTTTPFLASHSISGSPAELQNVSFGWGGSSAVHQDISLKAFGVVPTLTADLGGGWQFRTTMSYGESDTLSNSYNVNGTTLVNAIKSGLFNPYDPNSSDPTVLKLLDANTRFGHSRQDQFNLRGIVDGTLVTLPGGPVKIAVGAEYTDEGFNTQRGDAVPGFENSGFAGQSVGGFTIISPSAGIPVYRLGRKIESAFGELVVPLFGHENATPGFEELTFSASGRYDHYSDFGDTFNPKFGITWKPVDWVKVRGAWGKSFAAPSLANDVRSDPTNLNWFTGGTFSFLVPTAVLVANGYPAPTAGQFGIVLLGSQPNIQPQKATTWSLGVDVDPPFVPGLRMSVTYWNIKYSGLIAQPPFTSTTQFFRDFGSSFIVNPTLAQVNATVAGAATITGTACAPQPTCVYIIEDDRLQNLGKFNLDGLDIAMNYRTDTSFGSLDYAINANYELGRKQSASATSTLFEQLAANNSRMKLRASIGANVGDFRAQATWNHSHGYKLDPIVLAAGTSAAQSRVGSYDVFDLFFKYDIHMDSVFKDLALTLSVNNVFDKDPPIYKAQQIGTPNGYANGLTVGRLIQFGISTKF